MDVLRTSCLDEGGAFWPLWRQSDELDVAMSCLLKSFQICQIRRTHEAGIVGTAISGFWRKPWALNVIAADRCGKDRVLGSDGFKIFQLTA